MDDRKDQLDKVDQADQADQTDTPEAGGYDVGYCKPPKDFQFKRGQSGNPSGRPKGSTNLKRALEEELNRVVDVPGLGPMTMRQLVVRSLCTKACNGDVQAIRVLAYISRIWSGLYDR